METEWRVARARLRDRFRENRQVSHREMAEHLGYSIGWVRKWRKRLAQAAPDDEQVLPGQSHRPKRIARRVTEQTEQRIVALRISLSEQYHRQVGARTIAAYLKREAVPGMDNPPSSSATIWRVLRRRQYILVATCVLLICLHWAATLLRTWKGHGQTVVSVEPVKGQGRRGDVWCRGGPQVA